MRWALLPLLLIPAARAADDAEPVEPTALSMQLWGPPALRPHARALTVFFDDDGNRCVADRAGLHCVDDEGDEVWGVDLDIDDIRLGSSQIAVDNGGRWVVLDRGDGSPVDVGDLSEVEVAFDHAGELVRFSEGEVVLADGSVLEAPDDVVVTDVVVTSSGRAGAFDEDGGLVWLDTGQRVDLDVGAGGFLQPVTLDDGGLAVLDGDGLVIVDAMGRIVDVDVDGDVVHLAEGELWVATPDGVLAVDPRTGAIDEDTVADGAFVAFEQDGDALIALGRDGRITALEGDALIGPLGHASAVVALAQGPGGGLASVDEDGRVLRWRDGVPTEVAVDRARDVAFAPLGKDGTALWIATPSELVVLPPDGPARRLPHPGAHLLALPDGVLVGDGQRLVRLDSEGAEVWQADVLHDRRPVLAEGVVLSVAPDALTVLDAATGVRRRRLPLVERTLAAAGVAVGGLVLVGEVPDLAATGHFGGWRPGGLAPTPYAVAHAAVPALSPDGRWVAWSGGRADLELRGLEGWPVLARGSRSDPTDLRDHRSAFLATADAVWIGRDDGRIERWDVAWATGDTDLPRFSAYAQLDAFTEPPPGPPPASLRPLDAALVAAAVHPSGAVAVAMPALATVAPDGARTVPVVDPPLAVQALLWDPRLGLVAGGADGRVIAVDDNGEVRELGSAAGPITSLCATEDAVVAGGAFGLWIRASDGNVRRVAPPRPEATTSGHAACGPDGQLAFEDGVEVRELGEAGWTPVRRRHPGGTRSVVWLPDGTLATGGVDETVVVWDPVRGQALYVLEGHLGPVTHLAVDPVGARLLAGSDHGAVVWDLAALKPIARLGEDVAPVAIALAPDAEQAWIVGPKGTIREYVLPEVKGGDLGAEGVEAR